ncbi:hypothetical protein CR513_36823, partial [Mucuna pruriens]
MISQELLFRIGSQNSLDIFGGPFGVGLVQSYSFLSLVIHKRMDKPNLRDWENWILHVEFAYNRVFYSTTSYSPFELAYDFNPLSPLDLLPLPILPNCVDDKGFSKPNLLKGSVTHGKKGEKYAKNTNKGRKEVFFKEGDLVWVHLRKEKFPYLGKSKILPRGVSPFKILKKINDNAYKLICPKSLVEGEVLHPCVVGTKVANLRSNSLKEEEDDAYVGGHTQGTQEGKDEAATPALKSPMTRGKLKRIQEEVEQKLVMLKGQEKAKRRMSQPIERHLGPGEVVLARLTPSQIGSALQPNIPKGIKQPN